jgi:hypothetical protein
VSAPKALETKKLGAFLFSGVVWQSFRWPWQFVTAIVGITIGDRYETQLLRAIEAANPNLFAKYSSSPSPLESADALAFFSILKSDDAYGRDKRYTWGKCIFDFHNRGRCWKLHDNFSSRRKVHDRSGRNHLKLS